MPASSPVFVLRSSFSKGAALGLWILAGLAFLLHALFPGSTGGTVLAPVLLAAAVAVTGIAAAKRDSYKHPMSVHDTHRMFVVVGASVLALLIALTIIAEGDRRSWIFAAATTLLVAVLAWPHGSGARE